MKKLTSITCVTAFLLACMVVVPSCKKDADIIRYQGSAVATPSGVNGNTNAIDSSARAVLSLYLTSTASSTEFSEVKVQLESIEYNTSDEIGTLTGWKSIPLAEMEQINLLSLLHGTNLQIDQLNLNAATIRQIRIRFGENNQLVKDGVVYPLMLSETVMNNGAVIQTNILMETKSISTAWLHVDIMNSVELNAIDQQYYLAPKLSCVSATETGSIEGFVATAGANATVFLQADPNSKTELLANSCYPDELSSGYFRFIGLPEGTYEINIVAGDGTNRQATVQSIEVRKGEITNIGSQELQ